MSSIIEVPFLGGKFFHVLRLDKNNLAPNYKIPISIPLRYTDINLIHPEKAYYIEVYELKKNVNGDYAYVFHHEEE